MQISAPPQAGTASLPERFNFAGYITELNAGRPDKIAYIDDAGVLTYGQLADGVRRVAAGLRAMGVRRDERVLLLMHDCSHWPQAFLGCLHAGVVPVAVNTMLPAEDYAYMLEHSRAQAALVSAPLVPQLLAAMASGAHEVGQVVVSRGTGTSQTADLIDFDAWIAAQPGGSAAVATCGDDPAFWLYSSGSTGRPKGTVHSQANLFWTAELYARPFLGLNEDDVCFSAAKLFFAYGLGNALTFPLFVGATTILMTERPTPDAVFTRWVAATPAQAGRWKPTVFFGAPTGYAAMLASPRLPQRGEIGLRICSSAGEALPREIGERFSQRFGAEIIDGIGSTEMLHIFLSNRPGDVRYGTTGKPVPGYRVELRDESGGVIEAAQAIGDLYIQGPSSALLYWSNREKTRDTFQGAWTKSGDKYYRDQDGYYVYAGRGDDMLKVSGQYVSPFEVESTLMQHPEVLEAAVVGVDDEQGLTRAKAYVVLKNAERAGEALADELKQFVKNRLAPHKYPRQLAFIADLPKTATGKIQRFRLREQNRRRP
jgi:benzoate-CoA ligase